MSYWYSLNTPRRIVLSKQGYTKVDVNLPRKVVLVADCIVQRSRCNSTRRRVEGKCESTKESRTCSRLYRTEITM